MARVVDPGGPAIGPAGQGAQVAHDAVTPPDGANNSEATPQLIANRFSPGADHLARGVDSRGPAFGEAARAVNPGGILVKVGHDAVAPQEGATEVIRASGADHLARRVDPLGIALRTAGQRA